MKKVFEHDKKLEIKEELVSLHAMNPFVGNDSSARSYMFSSHLSQSLVLNNGDEKIIQSGLEKQFGQNTFNRKTEEDIRVLKVIKRYDGIDITTVNKTVETIIITESLETGEIDYISVPEYFKLHQYFGFSYKLNHEVLNNLRTGKVIPKDTVLAESPAVDKNYGYKYGTNANMCLLNLLETTEDGAVISKSFAEKLSYDVFETRVVEFGSQNFPLNIYGDDNTYKAFPEIGDLINDDSVIMVLRDYDQNMPAGLISINDVREFNPIFDKAIYVKSPGKEKIVNGEKVRYGEVVDIKCYTSNRWKKDLPTGVSDGIEKYSNSLKIFYKQILEVYEALMDEHYKRFKNRDLPISEKFHKLVVDAYAIINPTKNRITYSSRNELLDNVRMEFTIRYKGTTPGIGSKLTDGHGAKGVIVDVWDDDRMPYTMINGEKVRADVIMDPSSLVSRMNVGRIYEMYFSAISRKTQYEIRKAMGGIKPITNYTKQEIQNGWDVLLGLLRIIDTEQYQVYKDLSNMDSILEILEECLNKEVFIYYKVSSNKKPYEIIHDIEGTIYQPEVNHCMIPREDGTEKRTKTPVMIAPLYTILLGKTAESYLSVSSAKVNHFGLPIGVGANTRNYLPYRSSPTKVLSETEVRLYLAYVGRLGIIELKDRANSIPTHEAIYSKILKSEQPTNIDVVVDRNVTPYGNDSTLDLINNIFNSAGLDISYNVEDNK